MKRSLFTVATLAVALTAHGAAAQFPPPPKPPSLPAPPAPPAPSVPIAVSNVRVAGMGSAETYTNTNGVLIVRGTNVGAPGVTVQRDQSDYSISISAPRPDIAGDCIPPNCTFLSFSVGNIPVGTRSFTLRSPTGQTATGRFQVQPEPRRSTQRPSTGTSAGVSSGSNVQRPVGVSQPAPPTPRETVASATRPCPVTASDRPGAPTTPTSSNVFEVRAPGVQAQASMVPFNTMTGIGPTRRPLCSWTGPIRWRVDAVGGGQTVTINAAGTQTIWLAPGRYQIRPDDTFPTDMQYLVRFTQ